MSHSFIEEKEGHAIDICGESADSELLVSPFWDTAKERRSVESDGKGRSACKCIEEMTKVRGIATYDDEMIRILPLENKQVDSYGTHVVP
jgi:hypothetical protein